MRNAPEQDMLHARVTVVKHLHHLRSRDEARVRLVLAGKTLSATGTGDTLTEVLYAVVDVIEGELHDFRTVRRGVVKAPGPRPHGRMVRVFPGEGSGCIETEARRGVYVHANAVHGVPFAPLHVNMVVDLAIEAGHAGWQATRRHAALAVRQAQTRRVAGPVLGQTRGRRAPGVPRIRASRRGGRLPARRARRARLAVGERP